VFNTRSVSSGRRLRGRSRAAPRRRGPRAPVLRSRQDPNADIICPILHSSLYSLAVCGRPRSHRALGKIGRLTSQSIAAAIKGEPHVGEHCSIAPANYSGSRFWAWSPGSSVPKLAGRSGAVRLGSRQQARPKLATKCRLPHAQSKMAITPTGNGAKYRAASIRTGHVHNSVRWSARAPDLALAAALSVSRSSTAGSMR